MGNKTTVGRPKALILRGERRILKKSSTGKYSNKVILQTTGFARKQSVLQLIDLGIFNTHHNCVKHLHCLATKPSVYSLQDQ